MELAIMLLSILKQLDGAVVPTKKIRRDVDGYSSGV